MKNVTRGRMHYDKMDVGSKYFIYCPLAYYKMSVKN